MLFEVEKKTYRRCYIPQSSICNGCPFFGNEPEEDIFCIMEEKPDRCRVAKALGKL